jgi:hypothetical protein
MLLQRSTIWVCHAFLGFPNKWSPFAVLRFSSQTSPLAPCGSGRSQRMKIDHKVWFHPHSSEHDTQPIGYLTSKQAIPYRTRGSTCCPGVSTPKIQSLADSSIKNHITWRNPTVSPFHPCSNHNIDPHHGQITSQWMGDHLSQRQKPNSTSQRMERLVRHSWLHGQA